MKQEEGFSLHAQVTADKWFVKCEEVVKLSNHLIGIFPLRLRYAYKEMIYENTPPVVFNFILLYKYMVKDLREEFSHLKKVRGVAK